MRARFAPSGAGGWYSLVLGVVIVLIGLVIGAGGLWLVSLGGSAYYLLAGLGLIVSGVLLVLRRRLGAWLYFVVVALTILWALWEVGLDPWGLVPRIVAPLVLAVAVLIALPFLDRPRDHREQTP
jgi:quinoprotein glucose dehydrogenase